MLADRFPGWNSGLAIICYMYMSFVAGCGNVAPVPTLNADSDSGGVQQPGGDSPSNPDPLEPASDGEPPQNAPIAKAGADMEVPGGTRVYLSGEESFDPDDDEIVFKWSQVRGSPAIYIESSDTASPSLLTPSLLEDREFEFELTVSDGNFAVSDAVVLRVLSARIHFQVNAGDDQTVESASRVALVATITAPQIASLVTVQWIQVDGPGVTLSDPSQLSTSFIAPQTSGQDITLEFEVRAAFGPTVAIDRVQVRVRHPSEVPPPTCASDGQCDDGVFCNGGETCVNGGCTAGTIPCPALICNEEARSCAACIDDQDCSDGIYCNGVEQCIQGQCNAATGPCGARFCIEQSQSCVDCLVNADCSDGLYCNGSEFCAAGTCHSGPAPCAAEFCSEASDQCFACTTNAHCNDGAFCNGLETCLNHNCQAGMPPCGSDPCDESMDICVECLHNGHCNDGVYCNGVETCSGGVCHDGTAPCGALACNEAGQACTGLICDSQNPPFGAPQQVGTLLGSVADEASGLVASRINPNVLWTHNDDSGDNRIFAIHTNGTLLGTYTLGTGSVDPEDIAIGPGPLPGVSYIFWGNIGDNNNVRSTIFVKRVVEPTISASQSPPLNVSLSGVDTLTFTFPADATAPAHKDCETLLVDPLNGDIYVITKRTNVGLVYRAPFPHSTSGTTTLQYVASLDWGGAVGGDVSPDGQLILVRRYSGNVPAASIWTRPTGGTLWSAFGRPRCDVNLASEPQGEAIAWDADGRGYFTVSENQTPGAQIPIWYFPRQ